MKKYIFLYILTLLAFKSAAQSADLQKIFQHPPTVAKPWVYWYWMNASVSKAGITADLEAMKEEGIGGAYIFTIKGVAQPPLLDPPVEQLTPEWWDMVRFAIAEADRLGLQLALHVGDGFAVAGGPWITPELSMQKVVWTELQLKGTQHFNDTLPQPESYKGYYKDIAVYAFPTPMGETISTHTVIPKITTSNSSDASFLAKKGNKEVFKSTEPCWIQYEFQQAFTCRSMVISPSGNNFQSQRLRIGTSDDGIHFKLLKQLEPARQGWQDYVADGTYEIEPTTAHYFRFYYDKKGSEPGSEDLDAAKWKPALKIKGICLSSASRIHQYEGKNGSVWRVGKATTTMQVPDSMCVKFTEMANITSHLSSNGKLDWDVPQGDWTILRMGSTSTGYTNATGGKGQGLECDKLNPKAVALQFDNWFGATYNHVDSGLVKKVVKIFHVDSWECGSQNWSPVFASEFKRRRGYDLLSYLPVMAGIPIQNADVSERVLRDVRQTISELVVDNFYSTLSKSAHAKGCLFSAESVAPVMTSDGMLHFKEVDIPMGEFWFRSPTHDKPNDMLDAISGAHIYGKNIVQSESFTQLFQTWGEHPAMLKTLEDRNYALGINRLVYHVFVHNPWTDRKPGMTLDALGLVFQRDQIWWKPGKAWVEYAQRCQSLLQLGRPVADIAVFTGEEIPRRAILPDRLISTLPGIFGREAVQKDAERLINKGEPQREMPAGIAHSANMTEPLDWPDPLRGYAYDSFNPDALLRLAKVNNGRIELPGGASYGLLVIPGSHPMSPDGSMMSAGAVTRLTQLAEAGATILVSEYPKHLPNLKGNDNLDEAAKQLWAGEISHKTYLTKDSTTIWNIGKGRIIKGPYQAGSFDGIGIERDLIVKETSGLYAGGIAWTHRSASAFDIYFISNQHPVQRLLDVSLHVAGRIPEIYNPVTGETRDAGKWNISKGRTSLPIQLEPNESVFIVFQKDTKNKSSNGGNNWLEPKTVLNINGAWQVTFDPNLKGPKTSVVFDTLQDWSKRPEPEISYYSGTANYSKKFSWNVAANKQQRVWLDLGSIENMAQVIVNGVSCGVAWTAPYRVEITKAIHPGENELSIDVTNTWANRLIGDHALPEAERLTWTTAPYKLEGKPLLKAGLLGPVTIEVSK
jgi:hypothetical protein